MKIEILRDVVGMNNSGEECHPFKGVRGTKKGFYSFTLDSDNSTFKPISEAELRRRIEAGEFNHRGRIRMVPAGATSDPRHHAIASLNCCSTLRPFADEGAVTITNLQRPSLAAAQAPPMSRFSRESSFVK